MQFKDAAHEILKQAGEPLHYNEIADRALEAGILSTSGQTPHATMGALLYTDTLKENSRFRRGDIKEAFALRTEPHSDWETELIYHQQQEISDPNLWYSPSLLYKMLSLSVVVNTSHRKGIAMS